MKLAQVLEAVKPFLAQDKSIDELRSQILAADKGAKDKGAKDNEGLGPKEIEKEDHTADKGAKDKGAKDEKDKDDPEGTNDEEVDAKDAETVPGDPSTPGGNRAGGKQAVDSAEVDRRIAAAVQARDDLHAALRDVEPVVGKGAYDSAPAAYRAALKHMQIATDGVPDSALKVLFQVASRGAAPATRELAADSASVSELDKLIKGYSRLK